MPDTILITGVSGMIGKPLAKALAARGDTVIGLDPKPLGEMVEGVTVIEGVVGSVEETIRLIEDYEIGKIVHAGGISGPMLAQDKPYTITEANLVSTVNLVEAAWQAGIGRFVYASSGAAYGDTPPAPVPDDAPLRPSSLYAATKGACDLIVGAYRKQYELDAVGLRYSFVYGPGRATDCAVRSMIEDALAGRPTRLAWGAGRRRHYTYIVDAVSATVNALDAPAPRQYAYNIAGPDFPSMDQIAELVWEAAKSADIELGSAVGGDKRERLDLGAAKRDLGYEPQWPVEKGVPAYVDWLRAGEA